MISGFIIDVVVTLYAWIDRGVMVFESLLGPVGTFKVVNIIGIRFI